jgi:hypothetical protein
MSCLLCKVLNKDQSRHMKDIPAPGKSRDNILNDLLVYYLDI